MSLSRLVLAQATPGLVLSAGALTLMNESFKVSPHLQEKPPLPRSVVAGTDPQPC